MSGPQFFETQMGRRYYEGTMPKIAKALEAIAAELKAQNEQTHTRQVRRDQALAQIDEALKGEDINGADFIQDVSLILERLKR